MRRGRSRHRFSTVWRLVGQKRLRILAGLCAVGIATQLALRVSTVVREPMLINQRVSITPSMPTHSKFSDITSG